MNGDFALLLSREASDFYATARPSEIIALNRFFDSLASQPFRPGAARRKSPRGVWHHVVWLGRLEVTWCLDDPVREVRVLRIERL